MTAEDWAPYGVGEPDDEGWYPDYRPVPADLAPEPIAAPSQAPDLDLSWCALVENWRLVLAGLAERFHIDLHDPAVRARPWLGVRGMIFTLIEDDPRLRAALRR